MNLLAIETATEACSVALLVGGETHGDHRVEPRGHARLVLPMIDALLAEAGLARTALDGVIFGRGPGSFTGVRIAAAVTQGIALGLDIGVLGVSTLATLAQGCLREHGDTHVGVALDARLDEVYWGAYALGAEGVMGLLGEERVCSPEQVAPPAPEAVHAPWRLAGGGAERYLGPLAARLLPAGAEARGRLREGRLPAASDALALALPRLAREPLGPPEAALPVYLRERVALTEAERAVRPAG